MEKNKIINILSAIPVIIILLSTFSVEMTSLFFERENILNIPLTEKKSIEEGVSFYLLQEYLSENLYIPNYDSKINLELENKLEIGKELSFKLNIKDTGILPMDEPYFYIYLLDSTKKIRGCFPECNFRDKNMEKWKLEEVSIDNKGEFYESKLLTYDIKNKKYAFGDYTLMNGIGTTFQRKPKTDNIFRESNKNYVFEYTFPTDIEGDWEIYVLSLNSNYMDRKGQEIFNEREKSKIVNFEKKIITIVSREKRDLVSFFNIHFHTIIFILKIVAAFLGSIFTFYKARSIIKRNYRQIMNFIDSSDVQKRLYLSIIVILMILLIMQYYIMKG